MTKPNAHLVYESNSLLRANGNLVYARSGIVPFNWPLSATKSGQSDVSWANAVAAMEAATWDTGESGETALESFISGTYIAKAAVISPDLTDVYELPSSLPPAMVVRGELLKTIGIDVLVDDASRTWRLGWQTSDDADPVDDWTWVTGASSITGSGSGRFTIPVNAVLLDYLFIIISYETYTEPTAETSRGASIGNYLFTALNF